MDVICQFQVAAAFLPWWTSITDWLWRWAVSSKLVWTLWEIFYRWWESNQDFSYFPSHSHYTNWAIFKLVLWWNCLDKWEKRQRNAGENGRLYSLSWYRLYGIVCRLVMTLQIRNYLSWHFTSGIFLRDTSHPELSIVTHPELCIVKLTSRIIRRDTARVLTCCPYIGLIKKTTSSKMPNTSPYSVALAPFRSACKF